MRCCAGDEGFVALRRRPVGGDVKSPQAALAEGKYSVTPWGGWSWLFQDRQLVLFFPGFGEYGH